MLSSSSPAILSLWRVLLFSLAVFAPLLRAGAAEKPQGAPFLEFPRAGEYELHRIFKSPHDWVLEDSTWYPLGLRRFTRDKVTVLSFFYSTCRDPAGCPSLWSLFDTMHDLVKSKPDLHGKVRLVFISLDPRVDTPSVLELFAMSKADTQSIAPWHFLTTWSDEYLSRILSSFGQSAARDRDANGAPKLTISHQVKIYLIDRSSWVREIYVSGSVFPEVIEADIRTLLMEVGELSK